jgi:hypothetical protein
MSNFLIVKYYKTLIVQINVEKKLENKTKINQDKNE